MDMSDLYIPFYDRRGIRVTPVQLIDIASKAGKIEPESPQETLFAGMYLYLAADPGKKVLVCLTRTSNPVDFSQIYDCYAASNIPDKACDALLKNLESQIQESGFEIPDSMTLNRIVLDKKEEEVLQHLRVTFGDNTGDISTPVMASIFGTLLEDVIK